MGIDPKEFRHFVVRPTLTRIGLWSLEAEELLMFTAAHESYGFQYLVQNHGRGPAHSLFQVEPPTHEWMWDVINRNAQLKEATRFVSAAWPRPSFDELDWNMALGVVDARVRYRVVKAPLPPANNPQAMAAYWSQYYQTSNDPKKEKAALDHYYQFGIKETV